MSRRLGALASHLAPSGAVLYAGPCDASSAAISAPVLPSGARMDWRTQGLIAAGLDLAAVKSDFERDGYVIIKNVVGEDERMNVAYELAELVEDAAASIGRAGHFAEEPFETRLLRVFEDRLGEAPEIFRENTHLPGFFCLFFHPAILDIVSVLLGTEELRLYPNYGCRPKLPGKHKDEVLWHSDAGYTFFGPASNPDQPDSRDPNALTMENVQRMARSMINVWTPLVPVTPHNGCMQFSRGSHKLGLVEHAYRRELGLDTREGKWLHIDDAVRESHCTPESGRVVDVVLDPGDIVLFHQHMLHSSQHSNRSAEVRWALDFRFQDARESTLRVTQGHLARSRDTAREQDVIRNAEAWAAADFS